MAGFNVVVIKKLPRIRFRRVEESFRRVGIAIDDDKISTNIDLLIFRNDARWVVLSKHLDILIFFGGLFSHTWSIQFNSIQFNLFQSISSSDIIQ